MQSLAHRPNPSKHRRVGGLGSRVFLTFDDISFCVVYHGHVASSLFVCLPDALQCFTPEYDMI